jgi:hypothetical protein
VNQYQRSRFNYINSGYGPYNRLQADFRRAWETVRITDSLPQIDYLKGFSTLDLDFKYMTTLFKKDLILTLFGRANSVQENFSPIPVFGEKAFVRQWYEEFMFFYSLSPKVSVIGLFAMEQLKGNHRTELARPDGHLLLKDNGSPVANGVIRDDNDQLINDGKPIDQSGLGWGIGFDYDFSQRACIDVRYRWYTHEDKNHILDKFQGQEISVEFKIFY